jgi:hypothetical protein
LAGNDKCESKYFAKYTYFCRNPYCNNFFLIF